MRNDSQKPFIMTGAIESLVITISLILLATAGAGLFGAPVGVA